MGTSVGGIRVVEIGISSVCLGVAPKINVKIGSLKTYAIVPNTPQMIIKKRMTKIKRSEDRFLGEGFSGAGVLSLRGCGGFISPSGAVSARGIGCDIALPQLGQNLASGLTGWLQCGH
jgi:hypothetical protein